ncbi:MAG: heme-binding protein [Blastocatellia bacterium]
MTPVVMNGKLTTKKALNLAVAKEIAAASEAEARKNNWNVSIAIVDEAGRLLYFQRMDDATKRQRGRSNRQSATRGQLSPPD